jgi:hypothetical protein
MQSLKEKEGKSKELELWRKKRCVTNELERATSCLLTTSLAFSLERG